MKRLPGMPLSKVSLGRQKNLEAWLDHWNLQKSLHDAVVVEDGHSCERPPGSHRLRSVAPFEAEPAVGVGQIRLLSPGLCPEDWGPVYLAVLAKSGIGSFLIAPFSRFQAPATPYEIHLRDAPPALSVLTLWNARPMSVFVLSQSWVVDTMAAQEMEDARAVLSSVVPPTELPERLDDLVGPPLTDPRDVRFDYIDEEGGLWRNIVVFPAKAKARQIVYLPAFQEVGAEAALLLAAESKEDFALVSIFEVMRQRLLVNVFARPRDKLLFFVVTDRAGEPSRELDGVLVSLPGIGLAGQIASNQCMVQTDDPTELALRKPSGQNLHVTRVDAPSSVQPFSYVRLIEIIGSNPHAVSILTDSEVQRLMRNCPNEDGLHAIVKAEGYFRFWLYEGAGRQSLLPTLAACQDDEIERLIHGPLETVRNQQAWTRDASDVKLYGKPGVVWDHLIARIRSFVHADGIIPVVTGEKAEAIPIAFNLRANELPGTALRDITGVAIPLWAVAEEIFGDLLAQHIGVQLQCSTRGTGRQFDGESFELPIMLSLARKRGILPDYSPMSMMASGTIRGVTVAPVSGIEAKLALARKMGVKVFVSPGMPDGDIAMEVPAGSSVQDVVSRLAVRLEGAGLDRLDIQTAAARLNSLGDEIHLGTVSLSDAAVRLKRYEEALERDAESRIAKEGMIRAKVLKGAIANHTGDSQAGIKATQDAMKLATKLRMPLLYVNAMATRIVSLTDLGHLGEAESEGRHLLEWVLRDFSGPSAEQLQAEMVACGVLGGQALLQLALQGAGCGPESLRLLARALEIARELRLSADICRDAVQIALWHALIDPPQTDAEVDKAYAILDSHPGDWSTASRAHLQRVRFLGAYRAAIYHGSDVSGSGNWPLPDTRSASLYWVLATAQKYRGVLIAMQGKTEAAEKDFASAWAIMDRESAPLLRFIGGTIALAAGETMLRKNRALAIAYLEKAQTVFSLHTNRFDGPIKGDIWLRRTEDLIADSPVQNRPDPQKYFPY